MTSPTEELWALFRGRSDIWLNCDNLARGEGPLTRRVLDGHLSGEGPSIGLYPLEEGRQGQCAWICTDIDTNDLEAVEAVLDVWSYYDVLAFPEPSKSKGWHIWVFLEPTPGWLARSAGLWVHQLAGLDPKTELNPKQFWIDEGNGNCVRLPYGATRSPGRQVLLHPQDFDEVLTLTDAFEHVEDQRSQTTRQVHQLGRRFGFMAPGSKRYADLELSFTTTMKGGHQSNDGDWRGWSDSVEILRGERRVQVGERDQQFWTLACYLAGMGTPTFQITEMVTRIWRDQCDEPETFPLAQATAKVDRACALIERRRHAHRR